MNLPGMKLSTPSLTEKDISDIEFALNHRVDFIALSFVRNPHDIIDLRNILKEKNKNIPIIAKIEKPEAVNNLDEIINEADGVMVARGDLGVEMDPHEVPLIQKQIIRKARSRGKLVITATQMLESMVHNPVPTRAEATDVANAVWDGTDVVMLSAETSIGEYPFETVSIMKKILLNTEAHPSYNSNIEYKIPEDLVDNLFDAAGAAICNVAKQIDASLIVIFTHYGRKARIISKFRPNQKIIAIADKFETLNTLNLYYGVIPYYIDNFGNENIAIEQANDILNNNKLVEKDDIIIYTAGAPITDTSRKHWMQFSVVE
jgi:pyruvate kinase